jgi:hypothetical protein
MGCCGKNRTVLNESATPVIPPAQRQRPNVYPANARARTIRPMAATVSVRYLERSSVVVHGPVSGRRYAFSAANPVQPVDARDAGAFWHSRFFCRA